MTNFENFEERLIEVSRSDRKEKDLAEERGEATYELYRALKNADRSIMRDALKDLEGTILVKLASEVNNAIITKSK